MYLVSSSNFVYQVNCGEDGKWKWNEIRDNFETCAINKKFEDEKLF